MLQFFRQIRNRLRNYRNPQGYLLFALSQVIVVAVGIFIGLKVNNWNEQREPGRMDPLSNEDVSNSIAVLDVESRDSQYYAELENQSYPQIIGASVGTIDGAPELSPGAQEFKSRYLGLRSLIFMQVELPPVGEPPSSFIWSKPRLQEALNYYREYEAYIAQYSGAQLPESEVNGNAVDTDHLLRSIVREQLQAVMDQTLRSAQQPRDTTAAFEANLAAATNNFSEVLESMIEVRTVLRELEFTEVENWFIRTTESHALELINMVDRLSEGPRPIYGTTNVPDSEKNGFMAALFNISNEETLRNYLVRERQRVSYLAFNYANPPLTYLLHSKDEPLAPGLSDKVIKWHETLLQLDKYRRQDSSSHLYVLEEFFNKALQVPVTDCKYEPKPMLTGHDDVFAQAQEKLIVKIERYCASITVQL